MIDWLCYQFVIRYPIWTLSTRNRFYNWVLPRAGRYANS